MKLLIQISLSLIVGIAYGYLRGAQNSVVKYVYPAECSSNFRFNQGEGFASVSVKASPQGDTDCDIFYKKKPLDEWKRESCTGAIIYPKE